MSRFSWVTAWVIAIACAMQVAGLRLLVVSGNSMSPSIRDGDLVVTAPLWLHGSVGDIVLLKRPSDGRLLLHRVIEQGEGWRRTKGDASLSPDAERISDAAVLGGLAAVIPTGLFASLPFPHVAAQFSAGQLLPGGRATWLFTLTPCPSGVAGECAGATNTLRIDPDRFAPSSASGAARSLRITSTCRPLGTATWTASADLFTASWSAANLATGRLATLSAGAAAIECQVQLTLLGEITAANSVMVLPLRWGPE